MYRYPKGSFGYLLFRGKTMSKKSMSERYLRELLAHQLNEAAGTAMELSTRSGVLLHEKAVLRSLAGDMKEESLKWEVTHDNN